MVLVAFFGGKNGIAEYNTIETEPVSPVKLLPLLFTLLHFQLIDKRQVEE